MDRRADREVIRAFRAAIRVLSVGCFVLHKAGKTGEMFPKSAEIVALGLMFRG